MSFAKSRQKRKIIENGADDVAIKMNLFHQKKSTKLDEINFENCLVSNDDFNK